MKSKIEYIDKFTAEMLKNYEYPSQISWDKFNDYHSDEISVQENVKLSVRDFFSNKIMISTIAGFSIIAAGIFLIGNTTNNRKGLNPVHKKVSFEKINVLLNHENDLKDGLIENADILLKDSTLIKPDSEKQIVLRVEVPVIRNIEIKEKVFINDTIHKNDTLLNN